MSDNPFTTWLRTWNHKLLHCPTFWTIRPSFHCPLCGHGIRCSFCDGHERGGYTHVCAACASEYDQVENKIATILEETPR